MRGLLFAVAILLIGVSPSISYSQEESQNANEIRQFENANPEVRLHKNNGTVNMLYGTAFSIGATPLESASNHLNVWPNLYGQDIGALVPEVKPNGEILQGVMADPTTGLPKFYTFRFNQIYGGLPVFRSGVGFLVRNTENNPLVMSGFDVKEMDELDVKGAGNGLPQVSNTMLENVNQLMDGNLPDDQSKMPSIVEIPTAKSSKQTSVSAPKTGKLRQAVKQIAAAVKGPVIEVSEERHVIWAGINNLPEEPQLAVSFIATRGSVQTYPDYYKYLIVASASSGKILLAETQIHNVDVEGTVQGRATDGLATLECDPEAPFALPYAQVSISGGNSVFADSNGDFVIPHGGTSQVTVTSSLRGQWFEVFDQAAGNSIPSIDLSVTPPGPADFLHNPNSNQDLSTANVNAYLESNVVRDYVLSYEPLFPTIHNQQFFDVNTNIASSCNAFYDGSSINFYQAGGGCNNTSASDVIYHEYGHHLVNVTGNGQGQFGEGAGDCVGVLIQDEPILGNGFQGNCAAGIRTAANNHQYPCTGAIHDCGQLISGCVWSTRNELVATEPSNYRDISASLFLGMMIVRGQMQPGNTTIDPSITIMYLELDDDDNEIGNGTPHYQEIAAGFGAHNMDAPPLELLDIVYPNGLPEIVSPAGGGAYPVEIENLLEDHEPGTTVLHVDRGNGFEAFPTAEISAGTYEANFPSSDCATEIKYYFSAETTESNIQTSPPNAPESFFTALSADAATVLFEDDFNTHKGWIISGDETDGQWDRGVPAGGGSRGDPAEDYDGSGSCFLTDNVSGNSDVDGGSTILTSPTMDATVSTGDIAVLAYSRWYSNDQGNAPEADIFVVEISNDDGGTWSSLETVGPTGVEVRGGWIHKTFRIDEFLTPTNQMKIRFNASDLGDGSIVEAAVDAFEILSVSCSQTITPDSYTMSLGTTESGDVSDVHTSDDQRLSFRSDNVIRKSIEAEFKGVSPTATPSLMEFTLEAFTDTRNAEVTQSIALYNYEMDQYDNIDSRLIIAVDSTAIVQVTGDLSDYVEPGTLCVKALVGYERVPVTGGIGPARSKVIYSVEVDELTWRIAN